MGASFLGLVVIATGAFFYWSLSGFKGKFDDYMSRYHDDDVKYFKNLMTGLCILSILFMLIYRVLRFF